MNMLYCFCC